jgi:alpha-1,6-mannosyltransferase
MPIKTLHITNYFHSSSGEIRTFYRAILKAANRHRRYVRLLVPGPGDSTEEVGEFGRVYTIAAPRSPNFDARYRLLLPHTYALPFESKLRRILAVEQSDLIEICDKYTLCYLPSVLRRGWVTGARPAALVGLSCERMDDNISAFMSSGKLARRFAGWYMRAIYGPRFDHQISNSEYTAEELWRALADRRDLQVHVCPMGVETEMFGTRRRNQSKRQLLLDAPGGAASNGKPVRLLLCVSRISPEKNISLLPEMMEALKNEPTDYRLLVAGAGPRATWLQDESDRRVPGRVRLLGHIGDAERLADVYANCDALVHPNPREPLGLVPLEAMASGLPVIVPSSGGVLSYANAANCWLAEPTSTGFSAAVREAFEDDRARQSRVERAFETANEFSWSNVTARFFELYDRICSAGNHAPWADRPPVDTASTLIHQGA